MTQAKGVIPRGDDKELLYKNPQTCGYFIFTKLDPGLDRAGLEALFGSLDQLIAALVERELDSGAEGGRKVAAVAVGLAPSLFAADRFAPPITKPAGFRTSVPSGSPDLPEVAMPLPHEVPPLAETPKVDADILFYVASTMEARVNRFLSELAALPAVQGLELDRGYQRLDGTEPFGYKDGLRNIKTSERSTRVFVHRDDQHLEEPHWTDGGTYMSFMRITQNPEAFAAIGDDAARDAVMGRLKNGERLDLVGHGLDPHDEPSTPPQPPSGHVGKAGPRGNHDDTEIFRRGLPFVETVDGRIRVGLNFVSFQASLDQFDVIFNDWVMNPHFPTEEVGRDVLLDPNKGIVSLEKVGFFFVPPYDAGGLAAAVLRPEPTPGKPKTGRLVVRKRVADPSDPSKRFERGGFAFQVFDSNGQPVGAEFKSDSTGRALGPEGLVIGEDYILREISSPFGEKTALQIINFAMDLPHKEIVVENKFAEPHTGYGG